MAAHEALEDDEVEVVAEAAPAVAAVPDGAESVKVASFMGKSFALNEHMHPMAILEFADTMSAADEDPLGMGAVLRFVTEMIAPSDRVAFRAHCWEQRADADNLIEFLSAEATDEVRPTVRPTESSAGPANTNPKSASSSDVKVSTAFPGRPDLQLVEAQVRAAAAS